MGNQYTREKDMFLIYTGTKKIGCIIKRRNKYRVFVGKGKGAINFTANTRREAEEFLEFERLKRDEKHKLETVGCIKESNISDNLKNKYIACTNRVYKNKIREKIDKDFLVKISECYGDARKNSSQEGREKRDFNITFDYVLELLFNTGGVCPLFKKPFELNETKIPKYLRNYKAPSIDRWDNSKGYVYDNINIISWNANRMKGNLSLKGLELFCQNTLNYLQGGKKSE